MIQFAKKKELTPKEGVETFKKFVVTDPFCCQLFAEHNVSLSSVDDLEVKFLEDGMDGKNAKMDKDGVLHFHSKLLVDGFLEDDFHIFVHELVHWLRKKEAEELEYLEEPEERDAYREQIKYMLINGDTPEEVADYMMEEVWKSEFSTEEEAKADLACLMNEAVIDIPEVRVLANLYSKNLTKQAQKEESSNQTTIKITNQELNIINKVAEAAKALKIKIYIAGGWVRDKLLGLENDDLDFVVEGNVLKIIKWLEKKYNLTEPVHLERSGAWMVVIGNKACDFISAQKIMVTRSQYERDALDGDEEFTTSFDDIYRRDLTINTLLYDIEKNQILDPTGRGLKDLQKKELHTVIDPMIKYRVHAPDMLRALRFSVTKKFKLSGDMINAMRENAPRVRGREQGGDISNRRIRRELRKVKTQEEWRKMKQLIADVGLVPYIYKDISDVEQDKLGVQYPPSAYEK